MPELMPQSEFEKLPYDKLLKLLKEAKFPIAKGSKEAQVRDFAKNRLHGIHFIFDNEEKKDNKIVKKPITITKNYEKCPKCFQNKLLLQPFPKKSELHGSKWCESCGNLVKSNKGESN